MTAKEFVELFHIEKKEMIDLYFNSLEKTEVKAKLESLDLTTKQMEQMQGIIDTVLTDAMYTILLGLDGGASIGNVQQTYEIYDENGNKLSECGDIEQYAYELFHEEE